MKCAVFCVFALAMVLGLAVADFNDFNNYNDGFSSFGSYPSIGQGSGYGSSYGSYGKGMGSYGFGYSSFAPFYGYPQARGSAIGNGGILALFGFLFIFLLLIGNLNSSTTTNVTVG